MNIILTRNVDSSWRLSTLDGKFLGNVERASIFDYKAIPGAITGTLQAVYGLTSSALSRLKKIDSSINRLDKPWLDVETPKAATYGYNCLWDSVTLKPIYSSPHVTFEPTGIQYLGDSDVNTTTN